MEKVIDESMIDICKEGASTELFLFCFFLLCCWQTKHRYGLTKNFLCVRRQLKKILKFLFSDDQKKRYLEIFDAVILRV